MSKHEENSAATRARLIQLGLERFPLKGFSATSVRDLLHGSGLAIGAFYYHFAGKDEFFLAILESVAGPRGAMRAFAEASSPATLEEAVLLVVGPLAANPASGAMSLVVADFALSHKDDAAARERIAATRRHSLAEIADYIEVMQGRGLIRADEDAATLASMAFATMEGHVFHQEIYSTGFETALPAIVRLLRP
ncbi:MAG: TetR/AcrR family transcriptional regulator [Microbacteriaceae bacterium]|nr:TetR/AcrR family transcriptional regulator [Microbacteriaceae bacterium]